MTEISVVMKDNQFKSLIGEDRYRVFVNMLGDKGVIKSEDGVEIARKMASINEYDIIIEDTGRIGRLLDELTNGGV